MSKIFHKFRYINLFKALARRVIYQIVNLFMNEDKGKTFWGGSKTCCPDRWTIEQYNINNEQYVSLFKAVRSLKNILTNSFGMSGMKSCVFLQTSSLIIWQKTSVLNWRPPFVNFVLHWSLGTTVDWKVSFVYMMWMWSNVCIQQFTESGSSTEFASVGIQKQYYKLNSVIQVVL